MVTRVAPLAAEVVPDLQAKEFGRSDKAVVSPMRDQVEGECVRGEAEDENAGAEQGSHRRE